MAGVDGECADLEFRGNSESSGDVGREDDACYDG